MLSAESTIIKELFVFFDFGLVPPQTATRADHLCEYPAQKTATPQTSQFDPPPKVMPVEGQSGLPPEKGVWLDQIEVVETKE